MILVSACLIGLKCRYDGVSKENEKVINYLKGKDYIPVCPEQLGGLSTPRQASEYIDGKVLTDQGTDVTDNFIRGSEETLFLAKHFKANLALLKERSPSCGSSYIYDGSFSGKVIKGQGITSSLLTKNGLKVLSEENI